MLYRSTVELYKGNELHCTRDFPREFRVALACASGASHLGTPIVELLRQGVDWDLLLDTVEQHGLAPLLYRNVADLDGGVVPTPVWTRLKAHYKTNVMRNLALGNELQRVVLALQRSGVEALAYKGPVLARSLYGDVAMRDMCDLDVLVRTGEVDKTIDTLLELRYQPLQELSRQQQAALLRNECERVFQHCSNRFVVDLHWSVVPPHLCLHFDFESLWRDRICEPLGGTGIPTLCAEDLVVVLSVHGGKHFWQQLAWLADFARCAATIGTDSWVSVLHRADYVGSRRLLALAVFLARQLLGHRFPPLVEKEADLDRTVQRVGQAICDRLAQGRLAGSDDKVRWLALVKLADSRWDQARCVYRYAFSSGIREWSQMRLPKSMFWLYPGVRLIWLLRKVTAG
jgi:hypothetical protein